MPSEETNAVASEAVEAIAEIAATVVEDDNAARAESEAVTAAILAAQMESSREARIAGVETGIRETREALEARLLSCETTLAEILTKLTTPIQPVIVEAPQPLTSEASPTLLQSNADVVDPQSLEAAQVENPPPPPAERKRRKVFM